MNTLIHKMNTLRPKQQIKLTVMFLSNGYTAKYNLFFKLLNQLNTMLA
jgi:hypothetical protein